MRSLFRAVLAFGLMLGLMHVAQRWWLTSMVDAVKRSAAAAPYQFNRPAIETSFQELTPEQIQAITGVGNRGN